MELRNLKGTYDYLPQEQKVREGIVRKLQEVFGRYGYQPLETPALCYFDVLASKYAGGAEILKEVYRLTDQGGRELGLRYDLTVPFARVVGMNPVLRLPFKRYEIGRVFRDGPVKTGRNREFIQCDVDMVGVASIMAEAELLMMAEEVYGMLGLDVYIAYNNRKLLSGLIEQAGISPELAADTILSLDKLEKIGWEAVKAELMDKGIDDKAADSLSLFMGMGAEELARNLTASPCNERIRLGLEELAQLNGYIRAAGMEAMMRFSPSLARGLGIYTGTVWEVFLRDGSISSSVGAGGRYDRIIGDFLGNGVEYPAVGMTFGLDVIYEALRLKGLAAPVPPADLYLIPIGMEQAVMGMAGSLRKQGIRTDVEMCGRKLKKALDYANRQGIPYVIVVGENEIAQQRVKIKDMNNGSEYETGIEDMASWLEKLVNE